MLYNRREENEILRHRESLFLTTIIIGLQHRWMFISNSDNIKPQCDTLYTY